MYPATQTFWLEATDDQRVGLRRFTRNSTGWTCAEGWHQALVITGTRPVALDERGYVAQLPETAHDDPRWPTACAEGCGYEFTDADRWQDWQERLYRRSDTGELTTIRDAAPGACWDASWLHQLYPGSDGITLAVRCPSGRDWIVDSRASNCGRPDDNTHHCWVRHGDPRECAVTVDKNGDTCSAGAGSIVAGDYHGFLQSGVLTAG